MKAGRSPDSPRRGHAFRRGGCAKLAGVVIPRGVRSVGPRAFGGCVALRSIRIPDSVVSLGEGVVSYCPALADIHVAGGNPAYSSLDGVLFNKSRTLLIHHPASKPANAYAIPGTVTNLAPGAFSLCVNLTSVSIPPGVGLIGVGVFDGCSGLERLFFSGNAPEAVNNAFTGVAATAYHLPGTGGWSQNLGALRTKLWNPRILNDGALALKSGKLTFTIQGAAHVPVLVERRDDLGNAAWTPVAEVTMDAAGAAQFTDPAAADRPSRIYRFVGL